MLLANSVAAELRAGFSPLIAQMPPAMRTQVNLQQMWLARFDTAASVQDAFPPEVRSAARGVVRRAFAVAVTKIYAYSAVLIAAALLVLAALPETPLRRSTVPPSRAAPTH